MTIPVPLFIQVSNGLVNRFQVISRSIVRADLPKIRRRGEVSVEKAVQFLALLVILALIIGLTRAV